VQETREDFKGLAVQDESQNNPADKQKAALSALLFEVALNGASEMIWLQIGMLELQLCRKELYLVCCDHVIELNPTNNKSYSLKGLAVA